MAEFCLDFQEVKCQSRFKTTITFFFVENGFKIEFSRGIFNKTFFDPVKCMDVKLEEFSCQSLPPVACIINIF